VYTPGEAGEKIASIYPFSFSASDKKTRGPLSTIVLITSIDITTTNTAQKAKQK
jgi:hypothetical protein